MAMLALTCGGAPAAAAAAASPVLPTRASVAAAPCRAVFVASAGVESPQRAPLPGTWLAAAAASSSERGQERGRLLCVIWIPLFAVLTIGLVSLHKCQRGPGPILGAARLLAAVVPGLCQRPDNRCTISNAAMCNDCLAVGPECGWCTQEEALADDNNTWEYKDVYLGWGRELDFLMAVHISMLLVTVWMLITSVML